LGRAQRRRHQQRGRASLSPPPPRLVPVRSSSSVCSSTAQQHTHVCISSKNTPTTRGEESRESLSRGGRVCAALSFRSRRAHRLTTRVSRSDGVGEQETRVCISCFASCSLAAHTQSLAAANKSKMADAHTGQVLSLRVLLRTLSTVEMKNGRSVRGCVRGFWRLRAGFHFCAKKTKSWSAMCFLR
jgi:hypothetical protein